jgi:hypothetical protein
MARRLELLIDHKSRRGIFFHERELRPACLAALDPLVWRRLAGDGHFPDRLLAPLFGLWRPVDTFGLTEPLEDTRCRSGST